MEQVVARPSLPKNIRDPDADDDGRVCNRSHVPIYKTFYERSRMFPDVLFAGRGQ